MNADFCNSIAQATTCNDGNDKSDTGRQVLAALVLASSAPVAKTTASSLSATGKATATATATTVPVADSAKDRVAALEATVIQIKTSQRCNDYQASSANQLNKLPSLCFASGAPATETPYPDTTGEIAFSSTTAESATASRKVATTTTTASGSESTGALKLARNVNRQEILAKRQVNEANNCPNKHLKHTNSKSNSKTTTVVVVATNNCSEGANSMANDELDCSQRHHINETPQTQSFLFWKFLSNLPKSITQRSKSANSSTLTPEVVGYLARSKQQACDSELLSPMSTSDSYAQTHELNEKHIDACHSQHPPQRIKSVRQSGSRETLTGGGGGGGRLSQDDCQRKVNIVAPKMSAPNTTSATATLTVAGGQQHRREEVSVREQTGKSLLSSTIGHQKTTKLSIATSTTTTRSSASSLSSCILSASSGTSEVRLKWGKKMDFLLSIIGFAVDLANIWRFPYLVYKNGGGVFLIPYITMLIFGGIPLFFLELCLGQYVKKGPITVWNKICPSMKGVGYCSILISWYVSFYYNVLIAWSVYFIYRSLSSFGDKMPWEDCDNSWNSAQCVSISYMKSACSTGNDTLEACRKKLFSSVNVTSPASEFFVKELSQIDQSTGLDDMGYLRPELVLCAMIVYLLHYFSLFRGLETSGKVVWVTATAPYMILTILLVRGLFLPGASMGIEYYLSPKLEKLADPQVWIDAAGQVFYSIGVGFGVHLTYASFNSHNNNCHRDCIVTSAVNALTSVYSGLVVFVYLGYMARNLGIEIDKVASEGYSLVFEVYPEALTTLPFARFWSILFFIMLLTLGIDSAMGGLEAVITGLEDEFKFAKRLSRAQLTGLVIVSSFLPALISCTQGGAYTLFWFDIYSAGVSLLFSALFETIGVVYCYGLDKFILNIESMLGRRPHFFYIVCWKFISPVFLLVVIVMSIYTASAPTYRGYTFPLWSIILGWCLAFSSVSAVPIMAAWYWFSKRGAKTLTSSPDKLNRKRYASSSAASSRHGSGGCSGNKRSPNQKSTSVSCGGKSQSGLTATTTTLLATSHDEQNKYSSLIDSKNPRVGEDML